MVCQLPLLSSLGRVLQIGAGILKGADERRGNDASKDEAPSFEVPKGVVREQSGLPRHIESQPPS